MNHGCLQNHFSKRLIWVAEAGVNPADQRWGFWPLLPPSSQFLGTGLRGLSPSCLWNFVQLDWIEYNSPVVRPRFESCFTGNGSRQLAHTSLTKEILPNEIWCRHHTAKLQFGALETSRDLLG